MPTPPTPGTAGGGFKAIWYTLRKGWELGGPVSGPWRMYRALRTRNACKTCALGMGGQLGGMVNEKGQFPEVCKKSVQAMAADMRGAIHEHFFDDFSIEQMAAMSPRELEAAGRLTEPLYAGPLDSHYRTISWDEALDRIAKKLRATPPEESFFYFSGRSSNEAGFLLQLFARLYGTNNVNNCSYYCHQASGVGLSSVTGSGTATVVLEDLDQADLVVLIGANPASNHPRFMRSLMELKRRGGRVIVINPLREAGLVRFKVPSDVRSLLFGTTIADLYIQPHIGGDIALLTAIAKRIIERGEVDQRFVTRFADGWDEFRAHVEALSWDELIAQSGVPREIIERAAELYAGSQHTLFCWAMGITHHEHGVENVQAIANLAMTRGMLGRPGAGLLPLRGHSNVQGIGSMGVTPQLKDAIFDRLQTEFRIQLPTSPGLDTLGCMLAADEGRVRFALCLGGNLFGSNPDADFARTAMRKIDLTCYLSTTLNTGHAHGRGRETIILPVLARDEEPQATTQESMFNYVRLSDGGTPRYEGPRAEVQVIADLAERVFETRSTEDSGVADAVPTPNLHRDRPPASGRESAHRQVAAHNEATPRHTPLPLREGPGEGGTPEEPQAPTSSAAAIDWASMRQYGRIRQAIAKIIPGYEQIGAIDSSRKEFQIGGRTFHEPRFSTDTGRAKFHAVAIPPLRGGRNGDGRLRLMSVRSEGQFNTVVYEEQDLYRGQDRRDVIMMNAADVNMLGLRIDDRVTVRSDCGALKNVLVRTIDIPPGNAVMYYPECNVLVPKVADAKSKTPAFKNTLIRIEPAARPLPAEHAASGVV